MSSVFMMCVFLKIVPEFGFGHEAITPWNGRPRRAMVRTKKYEDEDFPNPRFKKERKYPCVNDHSVLISSALRSRLDYELHHGRINSYPSGGCSCSRACPHNPRKASAVE